MKWHAWSKWPLIGVAVTAVVLAAPTDSAQTAVNLHQVVLPAVTHEKLAKQAKEPISRVEFERLKRATASEKTDVVNPFNSTSWYEPPPPPPPQPVSPPAPVVPTAPPVPFTYFGRYENPPARIVMLARNEQLYTVSEGDVIDGTYRVEHITDGSVALVYLPLGTTQTISMSQTMGAR